MDRSPDYLDMEASISSLEADDEQSRRSTPLPSENDSDIDEASARGSQQGSSSFRKYKSLDLAFQRSGFCKEKRRATYVCQGCNLILASNEIKRLVNHIKRCTKTSREIKDKVVTEIVGSPSMASRSDELNYRLTEIIIKNNLPLRFVGCKKFKRLLKDICPEWNLASRENISSKYIPSVDSKVRKGFEKQIKSKEDYILSIEFDHWTDLSNRSLLGVVSTSNDGSRYLMSLEDVSKDGHTSTAIVQSLKKIIEPIPSSKINAFISDSASSCKLARETLVKDLDGHFMQHRCFAHFINRIGDNYTANQPMKKILESSNNIASFIGNNIKLSAILKEKGLNRVKKATAVRWYSNVDMLESIIALRDEVVISYAGPREREQIIDLEDDGFIDDVKSLIGILRPLANCIAVSERADGSLGEAFKALLDFVKSLFDSDWENEFVLKAIESFLQYFNKRKLGEEELGLIMSCYFLDRRYKMDYITEDGVDLIFKTVVNVSTLSGFSAEFIDGILVKELTMYCDQEGDFSKVALQDETSNSWWSKQSDCGILRKVGIRLGNLRSSSANIERLFSMARSIQGLNRTRFAEDTLENISRIKLNMAKGDYDTDVEDDDDDDDENNDSRSSRLSSKRATSVSSLFAPDQSSQGSIIMSQPEKLDIRVQDLHAEFIRLIDFSIVNIVKEDAAKAKKARPEDVDRLLQKFRAGRRQT